MKKFNVKALSLAVAAAVVSSAAGAAERDLSSIPEKAQNAMAFQTVFGENTKFDEDTGKFTFDKESSALLLKTMELEQAVNGFAAGSNFVATNEDGSKTVREATNTDIEADSMKGVGLAGGITAVNTRVDNLAKDIDDALDEQDQTVEQLKAAITSNNEQIAKVADDMAEMGKEVSTKFDEVDEEITKASTELSESIEKVAGDVTAVNKRVDTLEQETTAAKASAKAAEDKVTELSSNVDSKVKEAKDAADKAEKAASKIDAVADKADKASKGVVGLTEALEQVSLAAIENAQELNGFKEKDEIVVTDDNGVKSVKTATNEDVEADEFKGLGLKEVVAAHDEALGDLTETVNENSEALVKTAEVVNTISADVNANKAALEEQKEANEGFNNAIASLDKDIGDLASAGKAAMEALEVNRQDIDANKAAIETKADKADFEELAKYTADMGKKVNDIGDEVTALSDATSAAITRHDKDIVDLAQAGLKATEALEANRKDIDANKKYIGDLALAGKAAADALEANRQDIDANKAAIAENTAKLEEQKEANEGFNNAIASLDKDIGDLALAGKAAADALEANRQDIDVNKAAIETKADKTAVESVRTIAVEAQKSAQVAKGAVEVAQKSAETAESHAKAAKTSADAANNVASAAQTAAAQAQDAVKANATQVAANKADIATLQTASNQHAAGIAKNSARIDNLDKNVANLRKETRQGLAAQAALSGLFQPYSVGKFNVTAALGGFKSDTAVAVGAGYRFNENFAAKAGLAVGTSSGGSASYNVGVNYEW